MRLLLLALLLVPGCGQQEKPNILLITIDTLRADRLGAYGARTPATPNVDRLAREGLLFENAVCPMPLTRPSHFSIMTSRYPREHGVVNNVIPLPTEAVTLPEILREAGYRTGGFVAVRLLGAQSGSAQGFDTFAAPVEGGTNVLSADQVVPGAIRWLNGGQTDRPFFLWLHLYDPHMPYGPPAPFRPPPSADWPGAPNEISWNEVVQIADSSGGHVPARALKRGLELYAGEVAFTDHWLGVLLESLRQEQRLDDTIVAFTADHGECFDHGVFFDHSDCLYDGAIRVPLILRYPPSIEAGRRDPRLTENVDIAPTLLRLAGLPVPPEFKGADSLSASGSPAIAVFERPLYQHRAAGYRPRRNARIRTIAGEVFRQVRPDVTVVGLRTTEWKFIRSGADEELYDLRSDPGETRNVVAARAEIASKLRGRLQQWLTSHPLRIDDKTAINEELRETLRALGYIQ